MNTLKKMIEAVEENNRINGGCWKDWQDVNHLQDTYGELVEEDYKETALAILAALIRDNGEHLNIYLDAWDALCYGTIFTRKV